MATTRSTSNTPPAQPGTDMRPQFRVASPSLEAALGKTLATEAAQLGERKAINDTARSLLSGKLTLPAALLGLARAAARAVDKSAATANRTAAQQTLATNQLREELLRTRAKSARPRPRKDDYVLRGKVVQANGEPAAGLVVEANDKDISMHDLLGIALTDSSGEFQIRFREKEFSERGEKLPEILLAVGLEGHTPLHVTQPERLFQAEREASVTVLLPERAQTALGTLEAGQLADSGARLFQVEHAQAMAQLQQQQLAEVFEDLQGGLGKVIAALETQVHAPQEKNPPPARNK